MTTIKYSVPSINCNHCVHTIKTEISELEGVVSVEADAGTKEVVIHFDSPATSALIEKTMEEINFPVKK